MSQKNFFSVLNPVFLAIVLFLILSGIWFYHPSFVFEGSVGDKSDFITAYVSRIGDSDFEAAKGGEKVGIKFDEKIEEEKAESEIVEDKELKVEEVVEEKIEETLVEGNEVEESVSGADEVEVVDEQNSEIVVDKTSEKSVENLISAKVISGGSTASNEEIVEEDDFFGDLIDKLLGFFFGSPTGGQEPAPLFGPGQTCSSISQYGITWTFDGEYDCGQFVNGDWWVVGPVTVTSITPDFSGGRNGWEVNPSSPIDQGFDSRAPQYNPSLVPSLPYLAQPGSSIVKAVSHPTGTANGKTWLETAAVLTVLGSAPPSNAFRPPYYGGNKQIFSADDMDANWNILPRLNSNAQIDAVAITLQQAKMNVERVQLMHKNGFTGDQIHPRVNFQLEDPYGPDVSNKNIESMLRVLLAKPGDDENLRREIAIALVQYGIDVYGARSNGVNWYADGGHDLGYKAPMAFAAVLLDNQQIKDVLANSPDNSFAEGGTVLTGANSGNALWGQEHPFAIVEYWQELANPTTGTKTHKDPYGFIDGGTPTLNYQPCCTTQALKGSALVAYLIPGMREVYNGEIQLEYADRWVDFGYWTQPDPCAPLSQGGGHNSGTGFCNLDPDLAYYNGPSDFACQPGKQCGRLPSLHGTDADGGLRTSLFVREMWAAYRASVNGECGNSVIESGEACDDGDLENGDGCSATCAIESGWQCTGEPSSCTAIPTTTSISQYGITWTFSQPVQYGQFVNGDYWVVGPVTVTSITRPNNNAGRDGSMVNPIPDTDDHGYDDRVGGYVASLNVANQLPLTLGPDSSLVSTISGPLNRPVLDVGAVLTVLGNAPPANAFRPPYAGTNKPIHTTNNLQTQYLLSLPPVPNTPTLAETEAKFEKPWLDHRLEWLGDYLHPDQNMENYGAGMARDANDAALRLMLNDSLAEKQTLLYRYIQLGIDNYGIVESGGHWGSFGGTIGVGRKLPILFAGLLLNNNDMKNVAFDYNTRHVFQEDHQTFYLTQAERDGTYHPANCAGDEAYCNPGFYDDIPLGTPVWGERHYKWLTSSYNYLPGKPNYLGLTFRSTKGGALVVRLLGIEDLWNYNPYLEWVDDRATAGQSGTWGSQFADAMWDAYRATAGQQTCGVDADCSDGLFCNGVETCVDNLCVPGSAPCANDGFSCTSECNEATDSCSVTFNDDVCATGDECTIGQCVGAGGDVNGCSYSNALDGTSCSFVGGECSANAQCSSGACVATPDSNLCENPNNCGVVQCNPDFTCSYSDCPAPSDLALWYEFNGNSLDSTNNGNDATCSGANCPTLTADKDGNANSAYSFDGANDYLVAPHSASLAITDEITISAWVKFESTGTWQDYVNKLNTDDGTHVAPYFMYMLGVHATGDKARFFLADPTGTGFTDVTSSQTLVSGNWYHLAGTYDGSSMKIYVNGSLAGSVARSGAIQNKNTQLRIGAQGAVAEQAKGVIDDVRIYSRALSETEIQEIMNGGVGGPSTLIAEYNFEGDASDSSGNGNHGSISGANFVAGKVGQALNFDGVDDVVSVSPTTFSNLQKMTFMAWIYPESGGEGNLGRIFHKKSNSNGVPSILIADDGTNGDNALRIEYGTNGRWRSPNGAINFNEWNHIAVRYDASSTSNDPAIYINGVSVPVTRTGAPSGTQTDDNVLYIGNRNDGARTFDGLIDEVKIYDGLLSGAEIQQIMNGSSNQTQPQQSCDLTAASWSASNVSNGTQVTLSVTGTNCSGETIYFDIYEDDGVVDDFVTTLTGSYPSTTWSATWIDDGVGDPEFYFKAYPLSNSSDIVTSGSLSVSESGGSGQMASSITQYGITWTFDQEYEVGQFVNGDYWVVGPVTIVSQTPSPTGSGSSFRHGSMIDPVVGPTQAFDGRATGFNQSAAVVYPVTISGTKSLVSAVSWTSGTHNTFLSDAAVLTIVDSAPSANSFRPPFIGGVAKTMHSASNLQQLPSLAPVSGSYTIASAPQILNHHSRPWLWFQNNWQNFQIFPENNMAWYGTDISAETSEAAALLMLDSSAVGEKSELYRGLVQVGIDMYAMASSGGVWGADGGNNAGVKFPIVFAGWALNNSAMKNIASTYPPSTNKFHEDAQVFYVSQEDVDRLLDVEVAITVTSASSNSVSGTLNRMLDGYALLVNSGTGDGGGVEVEVTSGTGVGQRRRVIGSNQIRGTNIPAGGNLVLTLNESWTTIPAPGSVVSVVGYESSDIGLAEWGVRHAEFPNTDNPAWNADYRQCCTAKSWAGTLLAAKILGLDSVWNNDAAFDYEDRYVKTTGSGGEYPGWGPSAFTRNMWDAYYVSGTSGNQAPIVNAGGDKFVVLPTSSTTLSGSASDDGLPNPPGSLSYLWSQISGPAGATIVSPNSLTTNVNGLVEGNYVFRLTANDSELSDSDDVGVVVSSSSCQISSASWQNFGFTAQTGTFSAEFDSIPSQNNIDAVTGLSNGAASGFSSLAAIVRFNPSGFIDVRNGAVYGSDVQIAYTGGTEYHFRFVVDVSAKTYSVFVTPEGGVEAALATNYAFRSEQSAVTQLDNVGFISDVVGTHTVCDFTLGVAQANTPPIVSGISHNAIDKDPVTPGLQVYPGTTVTYSGSVSDADNDSVNWQWLYTINGGSEVEYSSGIYPPTQVQDVVFTYGGPVSYVWILRGSDGIDTAESTLSVQVVPAPSCTDADGDFYIEESTSVGLCGAVCGPFGSSGCSGNNDCNDADANEKPGQVWYEDVDGDGYSSGATIAQCSRPAGYYLASELISTGGDCNPGDETINPAAADSMCDGIDNDCDGNADDGYVPVDTICGVGQCAGNSGETSCVGGVVVDSCDPFAGASTESCDLNSGYDGVDNNCDGNVDLNCEAYCDEDGDGYSPHAVCLLGGYAIGDCDDTTSAVNPGEVEMCDGIDNDCDAQTVDGIGESWYGSTTSCGIGECSSVGTLSCSSGVQVDSCTPGAPSAEMCDGLDNDCDADVDEDVNRNPLEQSCYSGPEGTQGVGLCSAGVQVCSGGTWGECFGEVLPSGEMCDAGFEDESCNGSSNEGCTCVVGEMRTCGSDVGMCEFGMQTCEAGGVWGACIGGVGPSAEMCDGADNNCDGVIDETGNALCDDGIECTTNVCNGVAGCGFTEDDSYCQMQDGLFCNGAESCSIAFGGCVAGTAIDCSAFDLPEINSCTNLPDGIDTTLDSRDGFVSICDEFSDSCTTGEANVESACSINQCGAECQINSDCSGLQVCNSLCECSGIECAQNSDCGNGEYCDASGSCVPQLNNGAVCDENSDCSSGVCAQDYDGGSFCVSTVNACTHDGVEFNNGETAPTCFSISSERVCNNGVWEEGINCDNGLFCDGQESCSAGSCQSGTLVQCGDGISCTTDSCNENTDECESVADNNYCILGGLGNLCDPVNFGGVEGCGFVDNCVDLDGDGLFDNDAINCQNGVDVCSDTNSSYFENNPGEVGSYLPLAGSYNISNVAGLSNLYGVQSFVIELTGVGKIEFMQAVDLIEINGSGCFEPMNFGDSGVIDILQGSMFIDGEGFEGLDRSARLTFYNVNMQDPRIYRDGAVCATCNVVSYANGEFVVDVPGFSTYTVVEGFVGGGDDDGNGGSGGSGGGGGGSGPSQSQQPSCDVTWSCTDWSECVDGTQTRTCVDVNSCEDNSNKPIESRECGLQVEEGEEVDGSESVPTPRRILTRGVVAGTSISVLIIILLIIGIVLINRRKEVEKKRKELIEGIVIMNGGGLR